MSTFQLYLTLGLQHIADFKGYDHILFIITLCAVYQLRDWKNILILVTAFTIGHSLTLVLATFNIVRISGDLIEFLIPVTILLTAVGNILQKKDSFSKSHHRYKYGLAMFFGLIHGLGFSNYLRSLLSSEDSLAGPLFSFNLGIEIGQLIIVSIFLLFGLLLLNLMKFKPREWNLLISGAGIGISLILIFERIPF
ncbi:MAG: HupE/UreJ family protein [Bacteroidetes bacterium]|nr:HupE/UreJ family protein [Bacteroidota bacterium]MBT5425491.1 HupE/UreJ family protein [Bacteroidota bacterium]MBT7092223.1 HupE/UreJ family protein [Bacteroidota bacterium]